MAEYNVPELPDGHILHNCYRIVKADSRSKTTAIHGGMAYVYKAHDQEHGLLAIKEFSPAGLDKNPEIAQEAFRREVEMLRQLKESGGNAHIPNFYNAFDEMYKGERRSYLVMDFIKGKTLQAMIDEAHQRGGHLPQEQVMLYAAQLCKVLAYLHERNLPIVYRDLKPSNVMIDGEHVYLIDFGIARYFTEGNREDTLLFGTPGYAPPELIIRYRTGPLSDLFSLGATLHYCLTGERPQPPNRLNPFKFAPVREVLEKQQQWQQQRNASSILPQLDDLIMRLLATKEEDRPISARDVLQELLDLHPPLRQKVQLPPPIEPVPVVNQQVVTMPPHMLITIRQQPVVVSPHEQITQPDPAPRQYYDKATAQAGRLLYEWVKSIKRSGIPSNLLSAILPVTAWLLARIRYDFFPFCGRLGLLVIDGGRNIYRYTRLVVHNLQQPASGRYTHAPPRPYPPPIAHNVDAAWHFLVTAMQQLWRFILPGLQSLGLLVFPLGLTALGIIVLAWLQWPLHLLWLLLLVLLGILLFVTYIHPHTAPGMRILLAPALLLTGLACIPLISQHDMPQDIISVTGLPLSSLFSSPLLSYANIVYLLLSLAGIVYCWCMRGRLLLLNSLMLLAMILFSLFALSSDSSILFHSLLPKPASQTLFFAFIVHGTDILLLGILLSALLHMTQPNSFNEPAFQLIGGLLALGKLLALAFCALVASLIALTQVRPDAQSQFLAWVAGVSVPFPLSLIYLFCPILIGILFLSACISTFRRHQVLARTEADHVRPFAEFKVSDYLVMSAIVITFLMIWLVPTRTLPSQSLQSLWILFVPNPSPIWLSITALSLAAFVSLSWLRHQWQERARVVLLMCIPGAFLCLSLVLLSTWLHALESLFTVLLFIALLLLIGGVALVMRAETTP